MLPKGGNCKAKYFTDILMLFVLSKDLPYRSGAHNHSVLKGL